MAALKWICLVVLVLSPLTVAAQSPYLASRDAIYVIAGFSGIVCLACFLVQPLLAAGYLPALTQGQARRWHRRIGTLIIIAVILHVGGLFLTSPADVIDVILFRAPTWFSVYGVLAMWGIVFTTLLVMARRTLGLRYPFWQILHNATALFVVVASVVHTAKIEGTMGPISKIILCAAVLIATVIALTDIRVLRPKERARKSTGSEHHTHPTNAREKRN